jgi:hypothetical protein
MVVGGYKIVIPAYAVIQNIASFACSSET